MKKGLFLFLAFFVVCVLLLSTSVQAQDEDICFKYNETNNTIVIIACPVEVIPTSTPFYTETPEPTPTSEYIETPFPTTIPSTKACLMRPLVELNIRIYPSLTAQKVGLWKPLPEDGSDPERVIYEVMDTRDYFWGRTRNGWSALYDYGNAAWYASGSEGNDFCSAIDGWPDDFTPPKPIAQWMPPANKRGIHLGIGANCDLLLTKMQYYGIIKGITGTDECVREKLHVYYPDKFYIWRNWIRVGHVGDGPLQWGVGDPVAVANDWWYREYTTWVNLGLINPDRTKYTEDVIDLFEYRNEMSFVGRWEVAFDSQILRLANNANICLGMFSDGYGNPMPSQFIQRASVLDLMLETECQPGRHHVIAVHSYSKYDSGMWLFDLWKTFRNYLRGEYGPKYDSLYWVFTESGIPNMDGKYDGRGIPNCTRAFEELDIIDAIYNQHPEVIGYTIFWMGGVGEWIDWGICLQ